MYNAQTCTQANTDYSKGEFVHFTKTARGLINSKLKVY